MSERFEKFVSNITDSLDDDIKNAKVKTDERALLRSYIIENKNKFRIIAAQQTISRRQEFMIKYIERHLYRANLNECSHSDIKSALEEIGIIGHVKTAFRMGVAYFIIPFIYCSFTFWLSNHERALGIYVFSILICLIGTAILIIFTVLIIEQTKFHLFMIKDK